MQTFVDAGVTPLALGSADYPGPHLLYALALAHMDESSLAAYQKFDGEPDWAAWEDAATTFSEWVDKGYISTDSTGIPAQDSGNAFAAGKYPLFYSGTRWAGSFVTDATSFEWDQFLFPGNDLHPGSGGNIWVVPAKAKNKELAYDFINITLQKHIQNQLGNAGGIPIAADPGAITDEKSKRLIADFNELAEGGKLAYYPDWPVAGFYDALVAQTQQIMNGEDPKEALSTLQTAYEDGLPE